MPILHGSPEGRGFLALPNPRAFAMGEPTGSCPARAAAPGATRREAAETALAACHAQLAARDGAADCGCRVLLLDDVALAEPAAYAYAPGVYARLSAPALGLDLDLSAREAAAPGGVRRLLLSPIMAEGAIGPDGAAELRLGPDIWRGRSVVEGLSRGRLKERMFLTRDDGASLTLIVGWEPLAFAMERERLLTPP